MIPYLNDIGLGMRKPILNPNTCLNGSFIKSFSVFPLTRAHIIRPFSVLSVPAPLTYTNDICGSGFRALAKFSVVS
jgi:hypothetical protein